MKLRGLGTVLAVLLAGCIVAGNAAAQVIGLSVSNSPSPASVSQPLTYTISLTNLTVGGFTSVLVTNEFSPAVGILSASSSQGTIATNASSVVFDLGILGPSFSAQMIVTVTPTTVGLLTNRISIAPLGAPTLVTNNLTLVVGGNSDLGVSIGSLPASLLVGDQFNYTVTAANFGTNSVPGVVLSNNLPAGIVFLGVTPTNQPFTLTNNSISFNLGTLISGASTNLVLRLKATNAAVMAFTASVGASGLLDSNPANNTATSNITVSAAVIGILTASNLSAMTYNPQTGLMQQTVQISNIGTNTVSAARLTVSNLTHKLYNAVGTNNSSPFVVYNAAISPGTNVSLVLEYFVPTRLPFTVPNSNYIALGMSPLNVTPPAGTPFGITLMSNLTSGSVLIEFQAIPGKTYTILYSDNAAFTNARTALPSIVAPADRVQWIDDGPPKTISAPSNAPSRFYKVLLKP